MYTVLCCISLWDCDAACSPRALDDCGLVNASVQIDGSVECTSPSQRNVLIGVGSVFSPHLLIRAVMSSMSDLTERPVSYWARENVEESRSLVQHRGKV